MTTGDVYIGGEPYDVDDDSQSLIHTSCGKHLFGDAAIAAHVCWFAESGNVAQLVAWMAEAGYAPGDLADAVVKPWHYRDEAQEAGVA